VQPASAAPRARWGPARQRGSTRTASTATERRDARDRRRFERAEVRRFTRRSRNRRLIAATTAGLVATLVGLVVIAVYSPLLALRTVTVDGTIRVDSAEIRAAVDDQLGTPLALLDYGRITRRLAALPLIRSYVTEAVPPDTLLIHVVERQPVGQVRSAAGYKLLDPAGVTVQESAERVAGVPLIDLGSASVNDPSFAAAVRVLVALPASLLPKVDSITARTQDDVSLVLSGIGQSVRWGSGDDSMAKATLLDALIKVTDPAQPGQFDVSAPSNGIFRPS